MKEVVTNLHAWLMARPKGKGSCNPEWFAQLCAAIRPDRVILVAGTNGKGTVCLALEHILLRSGFQVLTTLSPHLCHPEERIRFQGQPAGKRFPVWLEWLKGEKQEPSFFEAICLMFLRAAKELRPDWLIVEVGIGGRFDFTNRIPHHWAVLTSIGLDHQALLGNSIEEIFWQKVGALSEGGVFFHYPLRESLQALLEDEVRKKNAQHITLRPARSQSRGAQGLLLETEEGSIELQVYGKHMAQNVSLAIQAGKFLTGKSLPIDTFRGFGVPGRFSSHPSLERVFLSGDHNPDGCRALVQLWLDHFQGERLHLIVGIQPQKDHATMLTILKDLQPLSLTLTWPFEKALDPEVALRSVLEKRQVGENIVITGSLYLLGFYMRA